MSESFFDNIEKKSNSFLTDALLVTLTSLVHPIATLTEIFFRKQMGERYFTAWNVIGGLIAIYVFRLPAWGFDNEKARFIINAIAIIWGTCLCLYYMINYKEKTDRYRNGESWHSYNCGIPHINKYTLWFEKGIPAIVGVIFYWLGVKSLGALLVLSVMVSLWLRYREVQLFREQMLNHFDSRIEQENFSKAFNEGRPPQETQGLMAHVPKYMGDEMRGKFDVK